MNELGDLPEIPEVSVQRLDQRKAHLMQQISVSGQTVKGTKVVPFSQVLSDHKRSLMATVAIAAVFLLTTAVAIGQGAGQRTPGSVIGDPNSPEFVLAAVKEAVSSNDVIVQARRAQTLRETGVSNQTDMWFDGASSQNIRIRTYQGVERNKPFADRGTFEKEGVLYTREVNHLMGTATESTGPPDPNPSEPNLGYGDLDTYSVVGNEVLEGVEAIHLKSNVDLALGRQLWVEKDSKLPIRMTEEGDFGKLQIDYEWIDRVDDANAESILLPPIPEGVTVLNTTRDPLSATPPAGTNVSFESPNRPDEGNEQSYCGEFIAIDLEAQMIYWKAERRYGVGKHFENKEMLSGTFGTRVSDEAEILLDDRTPGTVQELLRREQSQPWAGKRNIDVIGNEITYTSNINVTVDCTAEG